MRRVALLALALVALGCAGREVALRGPDAPPADGPGLILTASEPLRAGSYRPSRWSTGRLSLRLGEDLPAGRLEMMLEREAPIAGSRPAAAELGYAGLQELRFRGERPLAPGPSGYGTPPPAGLVRGLRGTRCRIVDCQPGAGQGEATCQVVCEGARGRGRRSPARVGETRGSR